MAGIVERYLDAIVSHDWDVVSECVADDVVRVGPYGDRYEGRDEYMAFIADTMPKLKGYVMELHRVTYVNRGLAFAELTETVEFDGKPMLTRGGARLRTRRRPPHRPRRHLHSAAEACTAVIR